MNKFEILAYLFVGLCGLFAFSSIFLDAFASKNAIIQRGIAKLCLILTIPSIIFCLISLAISEILFK